MGVEKAAEHVGIAPNTVRAHLDTNRQYIFTVKSEVEAILAVSAARKVEEIVKPAEDRIKSFFDRSFRLSEKALQRAEEMGDDIDPKLLVAIHKDFTVWASKFAASEAPKRLQMEGSVQHDHRLIGEATIERLTSFMAKHDRLLPAGPEVIEAVVVE
jgi:hypothetical protein